MSTLAFTPGTGFLVVWGIYILLLVLVLVPLAVILLLRLVIVAARLNEHARIADVAAVPVRENTAPVPRLAESLALIREIKEVARLAERHGAELEAVLGRPASRS